MTVRSNPRKTGFLTGRSFSRHNSLFNLRASISMDSFWMDSLAFLVALTKNNFDSPRFRKGNADASCGSIVPSADNPSVLRRMDRRFQSHGSVVGVIVEFGGFSTCVVMLKEDDDDVLD